MNLNIFGKSLYLVGAQEDGKVVSCFAISREDFERTAESEYRLRDLVAALWSNIILSL